MTRTMSHLSALSVVLSSASEESHDLITGALAPTTFRRAVDAWAHGGSAGQMRSSSLLLMHIDWPSTAEDAAPTRRERADLLRAAADCVAANLRDSDVFGRADATTLGLLLPSTSTFTAEHIARRLRAAVSARVRFRGQEVTLSVGLTQAISEQPWREAHEALRLAQAQGGDVTVLAEATPHEVDLAA
jgi:hypothetical protein